MKRDKQKEARKLRKQGISVCKIAKQISVSKSSVSIWVRDIELTKEQHKKLYYNTPRWKKGELVDYVRERAIHCKKLRKQWQREGKKLAENNDKMYVFCCALFWAEGTRSKNSVCFSNTDVSMIRLFVDFLRKYFNVETEKIVISVNCYLNDKTLDEIKQYWCDELSLDLSCFRKCTIKSKYYTPPEKIKYPYGVCRIVVNSTEIVQKIYGSIKYFSGDEEEKWLN